ncbi:MAG: hypothetical protein K9N06_05155, partial [Candidatus Cloacimonetes bacterium]|nr:hypothetical protein [Candidatus Cloacimonadota bacterium]
MSRLILLIILFFSIYFLSGQDELEALVTWEVDCGNNFICENFNKEGSDLNNDGYDDYIIRLPYGSNGLNRYQIFLGSATPDSTFDFETEVPDGSGLVSWGGDLNSDGYKDITFAVVTDFSDPGIIYICYGGEEIDLEPEFILVADDYVPYSYGLNYKAFNGGFDFNGDG